MDQEASRVTATTATRTTAIAGLGTSQTLQTTTFAGLGILQTL